MSKDTTKSEAEIEKLSAIRDIIFGNEIKEYNQEFSDIKTILDANKADSDKKDEALNKQFSDKIDALSEKMNSKLDALDKKLTANLAQLSEEKTDRQKLGDLLEKIGQELKS